jgi:2-desacetyl-2-hydroxyethyl bacteriochlorophyllide A dehydrogenase
MTGAERHLSSTGRAFWVTAAGCGELRDEPLPSLAAGAVLVETRFSAISRGTEALVFAGRIPPSQYDAMRCPLQAGNFPAPVKYGYASVGIVAAAGPDAPLAVGARIFALHPHQDRYVVPATLTVPVPDGVPDRRATLAANMETALNGLWDAGPRIGDRILVVGGGVVGCCVAALAAAIPAAHVTLIDVNPKRAAVAAALGAGFALPEKASGDADIVFHASGSEAGLATALRLAGFEALLVELSWFGDRPVSVPLGEDFHTRRLTLMSSQVGHVAAARRSRRSHRDRLMQALALLDDPRLDVLLDGETDFADLPTMMARIVDPDEDVLCRLVRYDPPR